MTALYEVALERIDVGLSALREFAGKVLLSVNVASKCGFTPRANRFPKLGAVAVPSSGLFCQRLERAEAGQMPRSQRVLRMVIDAIEPESAVRSQAQNRKRKRFPPLSKANGRPRRFIRASSLRLARRGRPGREVGGATRYPGSTSGWNDCLRIGSRHDPPRGCPTV